MARGLLKPINRSVEYYCDLWCDTRERPASPDGRLIPLAWERRRSRTRSAVVRCESCLGLLGIEQKTRPHGGGGYASRSFATRAVTASVPGAPLISRRYAKRRAEG